MVLEESEEDLNAIYRFKLVLKGIITNRGDVLLARKEKNGKPESGWHIPSGHLKQGKSLEEDLKRQMEEQTCLKLNAHQIVDAISFSEGKDSVQILYHCEAEKRTQKPGSSLEEVEWVSAEKVCEKLDKRESDIFRHREELKNFLQKLEELPSY